MRLRRLGRTELSVSECTLGTSALKGLDMTEASRRLALAFDHGINAVEMDAGDGVAASFLAEVFRREGVRQSVHVFARVSSLVPFDLPSPHILVQQAYPGRHIQAETEALLDALGVERLALQQLHAWCPEWLREGDWAETFERLREEGKIAGHGVSLFDHDVDAGLEAVASGRIDAVQVMYNIFDPAAATTLLPLCRKHDVGVIARSPLYYGALASVADKLRRLAPEDWRSGYFFDEHRRETVERVQSLAREIAPQGRSVSDLALRFSLSHPAVSTVAVGMRTRAQVEANMQALRRGGLRDEELRQLAGHAWLC
ncbi:aldo/keto reductase [Sphingomonas gilva]|nr:aldo/keto reductase [Sphingomonas gilva]